MSVKRGLAVGLGVLVVARSAVFVFAPGSHFDSDQAVTGLMAKHLAELRAFPVFWYGQTYMLGVEAWLAAPLMAIAGASVPALKLPLLAMNVAIALLLFHGLAQDGVPPPRAAFATLFFALAAPITSAHYLTANGGNVEPALYILLLWFLRHSPLAFGLVLGVGFLNREFTIYGAVALLLLDVGRRRMGLPTEAAEPRRWATALGTAAGVWILFLILRHYSSAAGPGTSTADLASTLAANNLAQIAERLCFDPAAIASGIGRLFTIHWPALFGLARQPLTDFGIESAVWQGMSRPLTLLLAIVALPVLELVRARGRASLSPSSFSTYLIAVSVLSLAGYVIGRCGVIDFYTMRYELLSVLGAVGLGGWYLRMKPSTGWRGAWMAFCAVVFAISLLAHVRLITEYLRQPPVPAKQQLITTLEARGVRYAYADYWIAYYVTFMTRERIIVASDAVVKVRSHNRLVDAHRDEAVRISRQPCPGGQQLTPAFWACAP